MADSDVPGPYVEAVSALLEETRVLLWEREGLESPELDELRGRETALMDARIAVQRAEEAGRG